MIINCHYNRISVTLHLNSRRSCCIMINIILLCTHQVDLDPPLNGLHLVDLLGKKLKTMKIYP
jgi:hypothetical protein